MIAGAWRARKRRPRAVPRGRALSRASSIMSATCAARPRRHHLGRRELARDRHRRGIARSRRRRAIAQALSMRWGGEPCYAQLRGRDDAQPIRPNAPAGRQLRTSGGLRWTPRHSSSMCGPSTGHGLEWQGCGFRCGGGRKTNHPTRESAYPRAALTLIGTYAGPRVERIAPRWSAWRRLSEVQRLSIAVRLERASRGGRSGYRRLGGGR